MERESFEDPDTAALMNERFVCIKLDREERPDLDSIYMEACQAMTGQGGWPLNVFLTPEQVPFFAGTYFPPESRMGMPSWRSVLDAVAEAWDERREEIRGRRRRGSRSGCAAARCCAPRSATLDPGVLDEAVDGAAPLATTAPTAASAARRSSRRRRRSSSCCAGERRR